MLKSLYISIFVAIGSFLSVGALLPASAHAQLFSGAKEAVCSGTQLSTADGKDCNPDDVKNVDTVLETAVNILSIVVGIAAVIVIIVNGLRFVVSGGDSNAVGSARKGIIYAIVGLIIVALAQFIVKFVLSKIT